MASGRHRLAEPTPFPTYLTQDPLANIHPQGRSRLKFDQTNILWSHSNPENITENILSGFWYFENSSSLCLDYSDDMLIDGCYETVEFENTYLDCDLNPENCITNILSFINFEEETNTCTIENYNSILTNQQSSSDNINLEYFPFSFKNSLISLNKLK